MFNLFNKNLPVECGKGLCPSPADNRDIALSSISPEIKRYPEVFLPPFDLTILNQGSEPSCVGQSCAVIKQEQEFRERESVVFNGSEIYRECKKIDGIPNFDGTYLRVGMKVLQKVGANHNNKNYKIASYARVDDLTFEGLKKAIMLHGALLAGYHGSNEGWRSEIVRPANTGEIIWQHAVALIGYERDYIIGQNSWGKGYHKDGIFKVPANYLPFEAWTSLDKPNNGEPVRTGWVASEFLEMSKGTLSTTVVLNIRKEPAITAERIGQLPKGTNVQLTNNETKIANGYHWVEIIY